MHAIRKILFIATETTTSEARALVSAGDIAREHNASITLMDVVDEVGTDDPSLVDVLRQLQQRLIDDRVKELARLKEAVGLDNVTIHVEPGKDFVEIIQKVIRDEIDLVIKPVTDSRLAHILWGTLDLKLMRKCPCPVWLIKDSHVGRFKRILAAVDPSDKGELGARVLDTAVAIGALEGSEVHALHVVKTYRSISSQQSFSVDLPGVMRERAESRFDAMTAPHGDRLIARIIREGDPADEILNYVAEADIDLVVAGTVARTGIPGFVMGNTAEKVLNALQCSVLTVKPPGFVSPVTLDGAAG